MKIFYHNDPDGQAACAVVKHFESKKGTRKLECVPVNFDKPFPYNRIRKNEQIYILDYRPDSWDELIRYTDRIIWIDHHETSIDTFLEWNHEKKSQVDYFCDISRAGCVLAWLYFSEEKLKNWSGNIPYFLLLVEDRDIWKWAFTQTANFWNGLSLEETNPGNTANIWSMLLSLNPKASVGLVDKISSRGDIINEYITNRNRDIVPSDIYYRKWNGLNCVVVNRARGTGSDTFEDGMDVSKVDIMVSVTLINGKWIISLYTTNKNIHVGKIAKKYGGGGHQGSGGFDSSYEDFPFK